MNNSSSDKRESLPENNLFIIKEDGITIPSAELAEIINVSFDKGVPVRFQACGFSMSPFIKNKDVITIFPLSGRTPCTGDIVAFRQPLTNKLIVHRIVGKKGAHLLLKGDNQPTPDGYITNEDVLGCVQKVERNGKKVLFGLGPERFIIAFLTRRNILQPVIRPIWKIIRPVVRRGPE